ncbi:hypothetical protein Pen01_14300 [Phytomonospora endophytica]|nr:hypothetical protein Pen01_14300 [Phytomonospora endophytica]
MAASRSELRRADQSATALIAVLTSVTGVVGTVESPVTTLWSLGVWGALVVLALASTFALGTALAGWRFISAVTACRGADRSGCHDDSGEALVDELRRLSVLTTGLVAAKYRRIRSGVPWLGLAAGAAFLWCLLAALAN